MFLARSLATKQSASDERLQPAGRELLRRCAPGTKLPVEIASSVMAREGRPSTTMLRAAG